MESLDCLTPESIALLHKHQLLQALIKAELIEAEIASVAVDSTQQQQLLDHFWNQQKIRNEEEFTTWLNQHELERESLIRKLTAPIRLTKHCQEHFSHKAEVRFLERKQQLDQVVYSLIRVKDPFKARELYLRIAERESDFATLATEFSEGREKSTRGVVGPVPLMQAHPKLIELLRSSQPGELREPIQIEEWNLIVRLEAYQPATLDPSMEECMAQELFAEWIEEEVGRKLKDLVTGSGSAEAVDKTTATP
jgi:parvulin-like peptidyl-prolyl isomerase